jgi:hypothetical protein
MHRGSGSARGRSCGSGSACLSTTLPIVLTKQAFKLYYSCNCKGRQWYSTSKRLSLELSLTKTS